MMKMSLTAGALVATMLASVTAANAHTPQEVRHMLQQRGYYQIHFVDTNPRHYQVNACNDGRRFHFHVNFYGEVTERDSVGRCRRFGGWWRPSY